MSLKPISQEQALRALTLMLAAAQKARSVAVESLCGDHQPDDFELWALRQVAPTLFPPEGGLGSVEALLHLNNIAEATGHISPGGLLNAAYLCHREPTIAVGLISPFAEDRWILDLVDDPRLALELLPPAIHGV